MERTFICVCDPCGHKLEVERLKKYDSMCAEELLEIVKRLDSQTLASIDV